MKTHHWLVAMFCSGLIGCATPPMTVAPAQAIANVPSDRSQVVFLRSSIEAHGIPASLYEVTGGELAFLGIIKNNNKIVHISSPGHRVFMVVSEAADFMEAELLPGKTYYSIVRPRTGAWQARFSLWPIRNDGTTDFNTESQQFLNWMRDTELVVNSPQTNQWFEENKARVLAKQAEYWPKWQTKTPEDLAKRTLNLQDGR